METPEEANRKDVCHAPRDETDRHVGKMLKTYRQRAGLAVSQLAKAVHMTEAQLQAIEAGREHVSASRLFELGKILDVPVANFFTPEDL